MKKILMTSALICAVSPAYSGPLLDTFLKGSEWTSESQNIAAGIETYTGFKSANGGSIEALEISQADGMINVKVVGLVGKDPNTELFADEIILSFDSRLLEEENQRKLDVIAKQYTSSPMMTPEDCASIDMPISVSFKNFRKPGSDSRFAVDNLTASFDILEPTENCHLEAQMTVSGISFLENNVETKVGLFEFSASNTLFQDRAPVNLDRTNNASMSIRDLAVLVEGQPQVSLVALNSTSSIDGQSVAKLATSGYGAVIGALIQSRVFNLETPVDRKLIPSVWNALSESNSEATFALEGLKIEGELPQMLTGSTLLVPGRQIDSTLEARKTGQDLSIAYGLNSPDLVSVGLDVGIVMGKMDPSFADLSTSALLMSLPVSVSSFVVQYNDLGFSDLIKTELGIDIVESVESLSKDFLGEEKAAQVATWLRNGANGGSYFSATPETPLGAMQLFAGIMGDWTAFSAMLDAKTTPQ